MDTRAGIGHALVNDQGSRISRHPHRPPVGLGRLRRGATGHAGARPRCGPVGLSHGRPAPAPGGHRRTRRGAGLHGVGGPGRRRAGHARSPPLGRRRRGHPRQRARRPALCHRPGRRPRPGGQPAGVLPLADAGRRPVCAGPADLGLQDGAAGDGPRRAACHRCRADAAVLSRLARLPRLGLRAGADPALFLPRERPAPFLRDDRDRAHRIPPFHGRVHEPGRRGSGI